MKKKLLAATLPLLGGAIIVGAGFSAWVFDNAITADSVQGVVNVTELLGTDFTMNVYYNANVGQAGVDPSYQPLTNMELVLDQGGANNTEANVGISAYVWNATEGTRGVTLANNVYIEITYDGTATELAALVAGVNVKLSYSIDYEGDPALEKWVTPDSDWTSSSDIDVTSAIADTNRWGSTGTAVYQSSALAFDWSYIAVVNSLVDSQISSSILVSGENGSPDYSSSIASSISSNTSTSSNVKPKNGDEWGNLSGSLASPNNEFTLTFGGAVTVTDKS